MLKRDQAMLILGVEALAIVGVVYYLITLDLISLAWSASIAIAIPACARREGADDVRRDHPERRPVRTQGQRSDLRLRPVEPYLGKVLRPLRLASTA